MIRFSACTYLHIYPSIYLPIDLPAYLPTYLPYLPVLLSLSLSRSLSTYIYSIFFAQQCCCIETFSPLSHAHTRMPPPLCTARCVATRSHTYPISPHPTLLQPPPPHPTLIVRWRREHQRPLTGYSENGASQGNRGMTTACPGVRVVDGKSGCPEEEAGGWRPGEGNTS